MIDTRVPLFVLFSVVGSMALADTPQLFNAWVRAMPPGQKMTAIYLQLRNDDASSVSILGASSTLGSASLHETRVEGGRSTMRPVSTLEVEAGGTLAMKPGGLHIMVMGLETTPAEGDRVPVCLQTTKGDVCVDAAVRRTAPDAADAPHIKNSHDHH